MSVPAPFSLSLSPPLPPSPPPAAAARPSGCGYGHGCHGGTNPRGGHRGIGRRPMAVVADSGPAHNMIHREIRPWDASARGPLRPGRPTLASPASGWPRLRPAGACRGGWIALCRGGRRPGRDPADGERPRSRAPIRWRSATRLRLRPVLTTRNGIQPGLAGLQTI